MSICDAVENWDDLSPEERFEQLKEWTQEFAAEWGIDPPDVVEGSSPYNNAGSSLSGYDPSTNTVYLSGEFFSDDSRFSGADATGQAAHETRHAMQWQYYGEFTNYEMPRTAREADAQDFGDSVRDFAEDECDPGDESAPEDEGGDDEDWELVEEEGGDDEGGSEEEPGRPKPKPENGEEDDPIA